MGLVCQPWNMAVCSTHPWKENVLADKESTKKRLDTEWKLNPELFDCIVTLWGTFG